METKRTPCASSGKIRRRSSVSGRSSRPNIVVCDGPYTSASRRPTRAPLAASATARFADTVLFPTPPLPDATATTFWTPSGFAGAGARGGPGPPGRVAGERGPAGAATPRRRGSGHLGPHRDFRMPNPRERPERRERLLPDAPGDGAAHIRKRDRRGYRGGADADIADLPERHEVLPGELRVSDSSERFEDRFVARGGHRKTGAA